MEQGFTNGQMEEDMKVGTMKTKNKDLEFITGLMAEDSKESGVTVREMVQESQFIQTDYKSMAYGQMTKEIRFQKKRKLLATIIGLY